MDKLTIERIGGLAGFGGRHLKSRGEVDLAILPEADQATVRRLFAVGGPDRGSHVPDGFLYRVTRHTSEGTTTVEAADSVLPASLVACVRDTLG